MQSPTLGVRICSYCATRHAGLREALARDVLYRMVPAQQK